MKKKIIALAGVVVLSLSMTTTAFAASPTTPNVGYGYGYAVCVGGYSLMWDQDGNFLDKDAFESNLDQAIADGLIRAGDREYYLERYDWCSAYGGGASGVRGGCGGGASGARGGCGGRGRRRGW